ncbi:unnamed protein product [Peniophora sp. CBMAI 1063]|nr:unnamed protein product [Peniophora sp. CBMAI 1063]
MFIRRATDPAGTAPALILHNNTRKIIGPIYFGHSINWLLLGTLAFQLYRYEKVREKTDNRLWLRLMVYTIFVLDVAQTAIGSQALWYLGVDIWGDEDTLISVIPWSEPFMPLFSGIIALLVQLFYAWRIWVLSRTTIFRGMTLVIVMLSLMQCGASIPTPIIVLRGKAQIAALGGIRTSIDVYLAASFTADTLIAGCMIWLLYQARSRTVWVQSQTLYDRLIVNSVQTGLITAVTAGVALALWKGYPQDNFYLCPGYILGKLYSNSLYSTLNGRAFYRGNSTDSRSDSQSGSARSTLPWAGRRQQMTTDTDGGLEVRVFRERERHSDELEDGLKRSGQAKGPIRVGQAVGWKSAVSVGEESGNEHVVQFSELSTNPADTDRDSVKV